VKSPAMEFIRKAFFFISLFTASAVFAFGQKHHSSIVKDLVSAMAHSNMYEVSHTVGFTGESSKQYQRYEQLTALATEQELLHLAEKHKNGVVRLYAWQGLKKRKAVIPDMLLYQFSNDRTVVKVLKGCIANEEPLNVLYEQELTTSFDLDR
jgi:hypothetical protein